MDRLIPRQGTHGCVLNVTDHPVAASDVPLSKTRSSATRVHRMVRHLSADTSSSPSYCWQPRRRDAHRNFDAACDAKLAASVDASFSNRTIRDRAWHRDANAPSVGHIETCFAIFDCHIDTIASGPGDSPSRGLRAATVAVAGGRTSISTGCRYVRINDRDNIPINVVHDHQESRRDQTDCTGLAIKVEQDRFVFGDSDAVDAPNSTKHVAIGNLLEK